MLFPRPLKEYLHIEISPNDRIRAVSAKKTLLFVCKIVLLLSVLMFIYSLLNNIIFLGLFILALSLYLLLYTYLNFDKLTEKIAYSEDIVDDLINWEDEVTIQPKFKNNNFVLDVESEKSIWEKRTFIPYEAKYIYKEIKPKIKKEPIHFDFKITDITNINFYKKIFSKKDKPIIENDLILDSIELYIKDIKYTKIPYYHKLMYKTTSKNYEEILYFIKLSKILIKEERKKFLNYEKSKKNITS